MADLSLTLEPRTVTGKKVKNLRKQGLIPASICGKGVENANFQLDLKQFTQIYKRAGRSTLIDLTLPIGTRSAFVRQAQMHPVTREYIHVDFRIVDLLTEMTADIQVVATGENNHVERGEAVVSITTTTLHVKALPTDLPTAVEVDISNLEVGATVHVSDLNLGDRVQVLTPPESSVLSLTASRMEAEDEAITEQEQAGEPELSSADADTNPDAGDENE